MEMMDEEAFIA